MKTDDLENELRNLKFIHLTESELAAYCDQELDLVGRIGFEDAPCHRVSGTHLGDTER